MLTVPQESSFLSEDDKLVIGWLVHGNSVMDLMRSYTHILKETGKFDQLVQDIKSDYGNEDFYKVKCFNELVETEDKPIIG